MDRFYLVVIVSAFVVLVTAAGLLVTKTHIVVRHARRPPFVRTGNKLPVFGKSFPATDALGRSSVELALGVNLQGGLYEHPAPICQFACHHGLPV
jgi:hypothetical protein